MKFVFYTNSVSPHQLPLARELVKCIGAANYRYVYTTSITEERKRCGWSDESAEWIVHGHIGEGQVDELLENCEILLSGLRELSLFERRAAKGLKTFYYAERWFKPYNVSLGGSLWQLPGWIRMLVPSYRRMAKRFVKWMNGDANACCLAVGPWAKKDFLRLGVRQEKLVDWGYFVEPSCSPQTARRLRDSPSCLKVLWVGRMLNWKRVDTIIRAVGMIGRRGGEIRLTLVGDGPEKARWHRLAIRQLRTACSRVHIEFLPPVPIHEVRSLMRAHDVYVLSSNAFEGWGATVNEALEEGMKVLGTHEAGASAAILPESCLFHAGDCRCLAKLLCGTNPNLNVGSWSVECAVQRLMSKVEKGKVNNEH